MDMVSVTVAAGRAPGGTPGLETTARRATGDKLLRAKLSRGHTRYMPVGKSLDSRYYQLLSGHVATSSFLHERMTLPRSWSRASADGTSAGSGSHAIPSLLSAEPGLLSPGGFGRGSGRIAIGSTRGHRLSGGYGKRRHLRLCWSTWRARGWAVGCRLGGQGWMRIGAQRRPRAQRAQRAGLAHPRWLFLCFLLCPPFPCPLFILSFVWRVRVVGDRAAPVRPAVVGDRVWPC